MEIVELRNLIIDNKKDFESLLKAKSCDGYLDDYKGEYDYSKTYTEEDEGGYIVMNILDDPEIQNTIYIHLEQTGSEVELVFMGVKIYVDCHIDQMD